MIAVALRNAVRHARHNAVLALLFAFVSLAFLLGNSLLVHSNRELRSLFVSTITGDFAVMAAANEAVSVFGPATPAIGEYMPVPRLGRPEELAGRLAATPGVEAVTPLVTGAAVLDVAGTRTSVPLFGIEAASYFSVVDALVVSSGSPPGPGERGVMLHESFVGDLERESDDSIRVGDEVVLTAARGTRFRVQAVPLAATFRYPASPGSVDRVAIVDAVTARALAGIAGTVAADDAETAGPRTAEDVDDLFGAPARAGEQTSDAAPGEGGISADDVLARVAQDDDEAVADAGGAVHFLLVRGAASDAVRDVVAAHPARLLSWREAAGQPALVAQLLLVLFNAGFALLALAVGLAVVNIVLVSTYRRTREIGTMRALGSDDATVAGMLLVEHATVAAAGWLAGLAAAWVAVRSLARIGIPLANPLLQTVLGGATLGFPLDAATVLASLPLMLVVVTAAALLPVLRVVRAPVVTAIRDA